MGPHFKLCSASVLFGLVTASAVYAADTAKFDRPDTMALKWNLEESLTRKFRDRISVKLSPQEFSVSAQVTFKAIENLTSSDRAPVILSGKGKDLPPDITLGLPISVPQTSSAGAYPTQIPDIVKITRVQIHAGLSSKLGASYRQSFTKWLQDAVRAEFGELGTATVEELRVPPKEDAPLVKVQQVVEPKTFELKMDPKAIEVNMPKAIELMMPKSVDLNMNVSEPTKPRPLNWEERFGNFQNVIGLIILAALAIFGVFLVKLLPSRDMKVQTATAVKIQEMRNEAAMALQPGEGRSEEGSEKAIQVHGQGLNPNLVFEAYREQQRKVAFIALSCQDQVQKVLEHWLDEGDYGRKKLAAVMDCVLTHIGSAQIAKSGTENLSFDWTMPEKVKKDKSASTIFRAYGSSPLEEKSQILESAYWDVLSAKALGEKLVKERFSSLSQQPTPVIQRVLSAQDKKARSITVLHLPPDKLEKIASGLSFDEKRSLFDQAFETPKLSDIELDVVDQSLTFLIRRESEKTSDFVEVPTLLPNFLSVLKPFEEITLIRDMGSKRPDSAQFFKQNYPSLAFLGEWPKEKLKALLGKSKPTEILALLQAMPDLTDPVLSVVAGKTRSMVESDIGQRVLTEEELDLYLQMIRDRVNKMLELGEINLRQLFPPPAGRNGKSAMAA